MLGSEGVEKCKEPPSCLMFPDDATVPIRPPTPEAVRKIVTARIKIPDILFIVASHVDTNS